MSENIIVMNVDYGETRVAVIENGIIAELLLERHPKKALYGSVFKGRVDRVIPAMQAAFVDIGLDRNAFLHVSDTATVDIDEEDEVDDFYDQEIERPPRKEESSGGKKSREKRPSIEELVKEGDSLIVQVSKEPISTKGARITAHVSLPGRYLVYMPGADKGGVSRKISDGKERARLSKILKLITPPNSSLIARTVTEGVSADALEADACYLSETYTEILERYREQKKPGLLLGELDLPDRVVRDRLTSAVSEVWIDEKRAFEGVRSFTDRLIPARYDAIKFYDGDEPIFDAFGIEAEIKRALARRVELRSGGSLIIDQAEALTAIDVNSGKFTGKGLRDTEELVTKTNLEAVEEIAYQLKFRNIGGLIVLDLIDMERAGSRRNVLEKLKALLETDRAKTAVVRISEFGLVEMTRERTRESLGRTLHEPCHYCDGTGHVLARVTIANEIIRDVRRQNSAIKGELTITVHPLIRETLMGESAAAFSKLKNRIGRKIQLITDPTLHIERYAVGEKP